MNWKTGLGERMKLKPCQWTYDEEHDVYDTGCGEAFSITDGTPKENGMKFCTYCGKKLITKERYHENRI